MPRPSGVDTAKRNSGRSIDMPSSTIGWTQIYLLSPELAVVLLAFLVIGLDLGTRRKTLVWLVALLGLAVPILLSLSLAFNWFGLVAAPSGGGPLTAFWGTLVVDPFALFFQFLFETIGVGVILVSFQYAEKYLRATAGE